MNPFLTSLGAFLLLKTAISRLELVIMVACFSAIVCIVYFKSRAAANTGGGKGSSPLDDISADGMAGLFFAFCCATSNSVVNVTTKKLEDFPVSLIMTLSSLLACIFGVCYSFGHLVAKGTLTVANLKLYQCATMTLLGLSEVFFLRCSTRAF